MKNEDEWRKKIRGLLIRYDAATYVNCVECAIFITYSKAKIDGTKALLRRLQANYHENDLLIKLGFDELMGGLQPDKHAEVMEVLERDFRWIFKPTGEIDFEYIKIIDECYDFLDSLNMIEKSDADRKLRYRLMADIATKNKQVNTTL